MIAVIDFGVGDVTSIAEALTKFNSKFEVTGNEIEITKSDKVILPGEGDLSYAVKQLHKSNLFSMLRILKKPFLGISLGMQLMLENSSDVNVTCLGLFSGTSEKFNSLKVNDPHIGWQSVEIRKKSILLNTINDGEKFYFSNSYFLPEAEYATSVGRYDNNFCTSLEKGNLFAVQFRPEKSEDAGLKVLQNFIDYH
jgi:glutamine amidotransferase